MIHRLNIRGLNCLAVKRLSAVWKKKKDYFFATAVTKSALGSSQPSIQLVEEDKVAGA
jgi:hypothetical protein